MQKLFVMDKNKVGAPSTFNMEIAKEICEKIAEGGHVFNILQSNKKYPVWSTFRVWKRDHPELQTLYINAIQDKSEAVLFEIDETIQELKQKKIDPSTANVIIQTLKWKAAKFYPKMYGEKIDHTTDGEKISIPQPMIILNSKPNNNTIED